MQGVFKKKSRKELQLKFKKEERMNNKLIEKCLSQGQAFDPSIFESDDDTGNSFSECILFSPRIPKAARMILIHK